MVEKTRFLLPTTVANELCADPRLARTHKIKIDPTIVIAYTTKHLFTRCSRFEIAASRLDAFLAEIGLKHIEIGILGVLDGESARMDIEPIYGYEMNIGDVHMEIACDDSGKPFLHKHPLIIESVGPVIKHFTECTGLTACVHFIQERVYEPPPRVRETADVHIVVGSSPLGETTIAEEQFLCGLQLHKDRHWYRMNGPTLGRGVVVPDEHGVDTMQVVDNVFYLFAPTIDAKTEWLFTTSGGDLFAKQMRLASHTIAKGEDARPAERLIETDEDFGEFGRVRCKAEIDLCDKGHGQAQVRAAEALATYREMMRLQKDYIRLRAMLASETDEVVERMAAAFARIRDMPLTRRITTVDDHAIHVQTKRIIGEAGGKHHDLGELMFRWSVGGKISIWPIVSTHPKGIPHPHIGIAGNICFGNVGPAIEDAFHEMHPDEGFALIYEWLTDGYDETLADVKITEWPEVTEYVP